MAKCEMSFPINTSAEDFLAKAKSAIASAGGVLEGDVTSGGFHIATPMGKVAGQYIIENNQLHIQITDKPMFIGCGMIESTLRSKLM